MTPLSYTLDDDRLAPVVFALFVSVFDAVCIHLVNVTGLSTGKLLLWTFVSTYGELFLGNMYR